jgi:hypothetical protein
MAFSHD